MPASQYQQSTKIPDVAVTPDDGQSLPSFVIEVGWTESMTALRADMELLLRGGEGQIKRGLIIKWYLQSRTGTVRGTGCLWALGADERLTKQQEETIFPRHQNGPQMLSLTRGQLWRGSLDAMRNPNEVVNLDLDLLRVQASKALAKMGLAPAP
ncbi:hypothetical protein N7461_009430 [Penicillium sp. DV-2018c]|nr:hypothetical protein N7461_009430 [Penicillium sp. DV-2018c]